MFTPTYKSQNIENLKKLSKSDLKKINGGNAPICGENEIPCHHFGKPGHPSYWTCEFIGYGCRN
ncbi:bacteriocin-like protein [Chryseobacterium sp. PMSZPI]|uniref:bacteriocin-like protein n=1 Tax=Chryseobacterium sp. PMSZPI TaxID=1033900 RepID=UPI0039777647